MMQWAYQEALEKHGSVMVEMMPCVFIGPSAVGKSSLKHLLVHNTPKAVKTSTAVMEIPEVVTISSEQYTVEGGTSAWQLVGDDVIGKSLQACVNTKAYDESQYPELFQHQDGQHQQMEEEDNPYQPAPMDIFQKFLKLCRQLFTRQSVSPQVESREGLQTGPKLNSEVRSGCSCDDSKIVALLDKEHSIFLEGMREGHESIKLNDAFFIHLLDTGGQPSFQDALPLLDAPCTYIQVFNAARDLDQPVPITYRPDDHTEEVLPPSTETGWEMMLRSFSSMQTMAYKCSKELASFQQEGSQLPQLRVFVAGTFKDQLVQEDRLKEAAQGISKKSRHDKAIWNISRQFKELKGKLYYHYIKWDPDGQPFYLINCMSDQGEDKACINRLREQLVCKGSALKLKVPVMWYICQQITQHVPQKFFMFNDLKAFCLKHQFIDGKNADKQFRSLLKFFALLGFYSFFDLKDVPDEANYVCTDRGMFLKEVSKLLAVQFADPTSTAVERFKETGILVFTPEVFQELGMSQKMDPHWFLKALCHLGIASPLPTRKRPEYFIPATLPHKSMPQDPAASVAPLCLTYKIKEGVVFSYSDLPQGVFCRSAVALIQYNWVIVEFESTRTLLKFQWKEFELFLQEQPGYICLIPQVVEFSSLSEVQTGCEVLLSTMTTCLSLSTEAVLGSHFSTVAELVIGFKCPCKEVNVPHLAVPSSKGESLICSQLPCRHTYTKQQHIWFSRIDGAEVSANWSRQ